MASCKPGHYINEDWEEVPLPLFILTDDVLIHCDEHGEWCPNAYYDKSEIAIMLAEDGLIHCPICLAEIAGAYV